MTTDRRIVRSIRRIPGTVKQYGSAPSVLDMPHLIDMPRDSYDRFLREGLKELFDEISPIKDFTGTQDGAALRRVLASASRSTTSASAATATRPSPRRCASTSSCIVKETGEIKEQELFMGDFPLMTRNGTFIINGAERVVVSQLVRSPGVYFTARRTRPPAATSPTRKLIPNRGAWLEFETSNTRRHLGQGRPQAQDPGHHAAARHRHARRHREDASSARTSASSRCSRTSTPTPTTTTSRRRSTRRRPRSRPATSARARGFYKRMRPGDPPTLENARNL